jgi:hypothetical protein
VLDDELRELEAESQAHPDTPSHSKQQHSESSMDSEIPQEDEEFQLDSASDSKNENEDVAEELHAASVFNGEVLSKFYKCITNAIVPTCIQNLGEKSHGKLKADQWYSQSYDWHWESTRIQLFSTIFMILSRAPTL